MVSIDFVLGFLIKNPCHKSSHIIMLKLFQWAEFSNTSCRHHTLIEADEIFMELQFMRLPSHLAFQSLRGEKLLVIEKWSSLSRFRVYDITSFCIFWIEYLSLMLIMAIISPDFLFNFHVRIFNLNHCHKSNHIIMLKLFLVSRI